MPKQLQNILPIYSESQETIVNLREHLICEFLVAHTKHTRILGGILEHLGVNEFSLLYIVQSFVFS